MRLLPLFALAVVLYGADPREGEIRKAQDVFSRCWNTHAKDANCLEQLLMPDFDWVSLGARSQDKAAFIETVHKMPDTNTWTTPADARIRFYGTTAIVSYGLPHSSPVEHVDQFTHVWVNVDGKGWRMARLHCSRPTLPTQAK